MTAFSRTTPPDQGYRQQPITNRFTRSLDFASRVVTRKRLGNARWRITARWEDDASGISSVVAFFRGRLGGESFTWFDPAPASSWVALEAGYGDGSEDEFDLPGVETASHAVYFDGVSQATGWSVSAGAGTDGRDLLVFTSAPTAGVRITVDFAGVRAWYVIATDVDEQVDEVFGYRVTMESIRA